VGDDAQPKGAEPDHMKGIATTVDACAETSPQHPGAMARPSQEGNWYALWTASHCEQMVYNQLLAKGFLAFLPTLPVWSKRNGQRHVIHRPMFSGYLFVRHIMDHGSYVEILNVRGLVCILGERWDRLAVVPDAEVEAIQRVVLAKVPVLSHPYLRDGQRVRVIQGPLAGAEGILHRNDAHKGMLVLSIHLFQRSVAVELDCTAVVPV
ncbi:MAG: transcription termination/antitermination protein NusG, partial [Nitrospirales bacterium]